MSGFPPKLPFPQHPIEGDFFQKRVNNIISMKAQLLINLFVSILLMTADESSMNIATSWTLYISTRIRNFNLLPSAYAFAAVLQPITYQNILPRIFKQLLAVSVETHNSLKAKIKIFSKNAHRPDKLPNEKVQRSFIIALEDSYPISNVNTQFCSSFLSSTPV